MFKLKYLLLFTLVLSACRVDKNLKKQTDKLTIDSTSDAFKRSLNSTTTNNLTGKITAVEFEYIEPTATEKAQGKTEPKRRVKKITETVFANQNKEVKSDSTSKVKTDFKKKAEHSTEDLHKVTTTRLPLWLIIIAALIAVGLLLYFRYGNLFSLVKRLLKKPDENNNG